MKYKVTFVVEYDVLYRGKDKYVEPGYDWDDSRHNGYWKAVWEVAKHFDEVTKKILAKNYKEALEKARKHCTRFEKNQGVSRIWIKKLTRRTTRKKGVGK